MQEFKIKKDGFNSIKKQLLTRSIPIMILAVAAGIYIATANSAHKEDSTFDNIIVILIMIPVSALMIGIGLNRGLKRQKALFESYTLQISSNMITRLQQNTPVISVYFTEIQDITKNSKGAFIIKGKNPADIIIVPSQIENYEDLEVALQQIKPIGIGVQTAAKTLFNGPLPGLLALVLMLCVFIATNKIIVGVTGIAFIGLCAWSFYTVMKSKNFDTKTKRNSYWVLLVMASAIVTIIAKLLA